MIASSVPPCNPDPACELPWRDPVGLGQVAQLSLVVSAIQSNTLQSHHLLLIDCDHKVIQSNTLVTLAKTPGYSATPQPYPQLTTPTRLYPDPALAISGPPESPWQAS